MLEYMLHRVLARQANAATDSPADVLLRWLCMMSLSWPLLRTTQDCVHMMPHLLCVCLEDVLLCMHDVSRLLPHCCHHLGVAVACGCGTNACRTAHTGA
jgi:hypothetical protein